MSSNNNEIMNNTYENERVVDPIIICFRCLFSLLRLRRSFVHKNLINLHVVDAGKSQYKIIELFCSLSKCLFSDLLQKVTLVKQRKKNTISCAQIWIKNKTFLFHNVNVTHEQLIWFCLNCMQITDVDLL